jgi:cyclase
VAAQRDYFTHLVDEVTPRAQAGMSPRDAARDLDLGPYSGLGEPERLVANVAAVYRDLGLDAPSAAADLLAEMAAFATTP